MLRFGRVDKKTESIYFSVTSCLCVNMRPVRGAAEEPYLCQYCSG